MLVDQGSGAVVPPTLHGVIAARLDTMPPTVKHLLQEASVVGREFWLDALATEHHGANGDADEAERRGLVGRTAARGPTGTHTYSFRHGLIRDVAYASLSKAERTQVHDHYSRWLERAAGERASEYAEIVAYHAERAFQFAHELDPSGGAELGRRAFTLLSRSAAAASARGDFRTARELSDRALSVADSSGVPTAERAAVQALSAIVKLRLDSDAAAVGELDHAIASARAVGPSDDLVRLLIWRASSVTIFDDVAAAQNLFAEAVAVARATGDQGMVAYAVWASAEPVGFTGRLDEQARLLTEALAEMRKAGVAQWEVACLTEIALNAIERGDVELARSRAREALGPATASGRRVDGFKAADAWARVLLASGDDGALAAAEELVSLAREVGGPWAMARAAEVASLARELAGDTDGASRVLVETLAELDSARMPTQREAIARLEAMRARLALASGDLATARASAAAARGAAPQTHVAARASANLAAAAVALAEGDTGEARQLIEEARSLLAPTQYRGLRERADLMARDLVQTSTDRRSPAR
jgi:tetratricopeptide (TPR) repeat protein